MLGISTLLCLVESVTDGRIAPAACRTLAYYLTSDASQDEIQALETHGSVLY
jgi:hypothetical protein